MGLAKKLDGYRQRAVYEWNQARRRSAARGREAVFQSWLDALSSKPPEVLVGANFAAYGGVRHHIQAIQRYSSLDVQLAPPESVLQTVAPHHLTHDFGQRFMDFKATGIRAVHSHVFPWFIKWCRDKQESGARWVHTYHLNYFPEHGHASLEPWQVEINDALINEACHADIRLSVSKWQVEHLYREHGIESQYLPNGVDVALCDKADGRRFSRKHALVNFVLWVGRSDPVKNPQEFVRLAARLPKETFVMIGSGLTSDALLKGWAVDVPSNLRVFESLPHSEVLDAIAACSALVVTSKREGLPTLVMEGMAQAKPLVVPNEAGCMEVVNYGEVGLIYELGNLDDLANKLTESKVDMVRSRLARHWVLEQYDWRNVARLLDAVYKGA